MEEENKKIGTLIKTFGGKRISANGDKYDVIVVWYRDENGKKQVIYYDRPKVPYYIIKDKTSIEAKYPPLYIDKNKVDRFESYSDSKFVFINEPLMSNNGTCNKIANEFINQTIKRVSSHWKVCR